MDEYLEILTELGESTGKKKCRTEIHKTGEWHRTVHIWIINDKNELLLQKRHSKKEGSPGKWDISCGGHCSDGETSLQGAIRELDEELGLNIPLDKIEQLFTIKYTSQLGLNNEFVDVYLIECNYEISTLKFQEDEIEELTSINYKELQRLYYEPEFNIARKDNEYEKLFDMLNKRLDFA